MFSQVSTSLVRPMKQRLFPAMFQTGEPYPANPRLRLPSPRFLLHVYYRKVRKGETSPLFSLFPPPRERRCPLRGEEGRGRNLNLNLAVISPQSDLVVPGSRFLNPTLNRGVGDWGFDVELGFLVPVCFYYV